MSSNKKLFDNNLQRIDSLCSFYNQLKKDMKTDQNKDYKFTDMLRAATVFLHAAFEEYYRGVITEWLPIKGSQDSLKAINLPADAGKNITKIYLSDLLPYKDKTVNEVFREAVHEQMSRTSFNNYSDISSWASKVGLNIADFSRAKDIDDAVKRRHIIVHEADWDNQSVKLRKIQESDVEKWKNAYSELVALIDAQIVAWESL